MSTLRSRPGLWLPSGGALWRGIAGATLALACVLATGAARAEEARPAQSRRPVTGAKPTPAPATQAAPASGGAPVERAATESKLAPPVGDAPTPVVASEEGKEGVKTYKFGAVEVEGRLRSPQLIYFLRRVRAEFAASGLGHRSFLRELSETERHPSFR